MVPPMKAILFITFLVTSLLCGCQTPERTAYRTLGSIAITVDTAVQSYYHYRDATPAHYNADLDAKIKEGYLHYQAAMKVAQKAQESFKTGILTEDVWEASLNAVSASAADIVSLIRSFLPKEKVNP